MSKLVIKDLHVSVEEKEILKGITLSFETGKSYAIIGPNGNGKSTLFSTIIGDPNFKITKGSIVLDGNDITKLSTDERVKLGMFLAMQYPVEIEGINNFELIKASMSKITGKPVNTLASYTKAIKLLKDLRLEEEFLERDVNLGFSGGEKKKNEMLHLLMSEPKFAFLDEVDSGLDIDSINSISKKIYEYKNKERSVIIISHYKKLLETVKPEVFYLIKNGKVSSTGNYEELIKLLARGFDD